jgi:broad specificity phosphatase PhoE
MQLILARHGNTFAPGDKVVWVGARTDLPLVDKGLRQAQAIADGLTAAGLLPAHIVTGPLKRTRDTATIVARACHVASAAVTVSEDLREIDYGRWEGRSDADIRGEFGDRLVDDWQALGIWPDGCDWQPGEAAVVAAWNRLLDVLRHDRPADVVVLVVSSNGIFRLVAKTLGLPPDRAKMATGAVAHLVVENDGVRIVSWNVDPGKLGAA